MNKIKLDRRINDISIFAARMRVIPPKLMITEELSIFKKLPGNREIDENHVRKLANKMIQTPELLWDPILVNEKMQVIDGQHRIEATRLLWKERGVVLPLTYLVIPGLTIAHIMLLNSHQKPWKPIDYLKSYALQEYPDYKIILGVIEAHPKIAHNLILSYAMKNKYSKQELESGKLQVRDISELRKRLVMLEDFGRLYEKWYRSTFAKALYYFIRDKRYNHQRMLSQLSKYKDEIVKGDYEQKKYIYILQEIYNRDYPESSQVTFY